MIEWLTVVFAGGVVALAGVLSGIAWSASRRFEEGRFRYIALAFLMLCITGVMSIVDEITDLFDEQFAVEPGPLLLIVVALTFLYMGLLRSRRPNHSPQHG